jgi:hypothetical protein
MKPNGRTETNRELQKVLMAIEDPTYKFFRRKKWQVFFLVGNESLHILQRPSGAGRSENLETGREQFSPRTNKTLNANGQ